MLWKRTQCVEKEKIQRREGLRFVARFKLYDGRNGFEFELRKVGKGFEFDLF